MPFEHYDQFFTLSAAGLGLVLVGGVNLALGRKGGRVWLRLAVTLAVCAAVTAGLFALTRAELAARAAGVMGGVLAVATLAGSGWLSRKLSALASYLRKPAPRWALVGFGGLAVILGSGLAFDRADEAATEQGMKELDLAMGRPPTQPSERGHATTDRGNRIVLKEATEPRDEGDLTATEHKTLRDSPVHDQVIRRGVATDHSNCHGWVFTGGKFLLSPEDVELILKENGYRETPEPQPGDLVVYRQGGAIAHTAVVRYVTEGQPVLVEGKWGTMGVFLHPADKSFYGPEYTFHRSARTGHLLVGLGGSPGPATEMATTVEE